jgi:hypothetical protein
MMRNFQRIAQRADVVPPALAAQLTTTHNEIQWSDAEMRKLMAFDPITGVISFGHGGADPQLVRTFIRKLTNDLLALPGASNDMPLKHTLSNGVYMREMFIPKGTLLVGKIHKLECINIVSKGDISILTETGSGRITAGHTAVSPAGIQKVGFANEDTIFINIFRTEEADIEKIESAIAYESFEAFDGAIAASVTNTIERG